MSGTQPFIIEATWWRSGVRLTYGLRGAAAATHALRVWMADARYTVIVLRWHRRTLTKPPARIRGIVLRRLGGRWKWDVVEGLGVVRELSDLPAADAVQAGRV